MCLVRCAHNRRGLCVLPPPSPHDRNGRDLVSVTFGPGDVALLVDRKSRQWLVDLRPGGEFHSHAGVLRHDDIIGAPPGVEVRTTSGTTVTALRPTLAEYVLKMRRGAQIVYPKDSAAIVMLADVFPGARVVEAGIGSGALTMALLRAVGDRGHVTSYEIRQDHAAHAIANIERFMGKVPNHRLCIGDVATDLDEDVLDRIVLDLPEPWRVAPAARRALVPGGIVLTYLPTVPQVQQAVTALEESGFGMLDTVEVLHRTWNVSGASVRPDHRMVAHTGFLTVGRLLCPST